jgi:hypothetical protein
MTQISKDEANANMLGVKSSGVGALLPSRSRAGQLPFILGVFGSRCMLHRVMRVSVSGKQNVPSVVLKHADAIIHRPNIEVSAAIGWAGRALTYLVCFLTSKTIPPSNDAA